MPSVSRFYRYCGISFFVDLRFFLIRCICPMCVACFSVTYFDMFACVSSGHWRRIFLAAAAGTVLLEQFENSAW